MKPLTRLWKLIALESKDIKAVYFYAILNGLVQLSVPIGIQTIVGLVMGATMVTSISVLIVLIVLGVLLVGIFQVNQMKIIERIQQRIFTRFAFDFAETIPRLDLHKMDDYYLPEKVNRFFDTLTVQKSLSKILLKIPTASIQIIFGIILLSFYHPIFIVFGTILLFLLWLILKLSSTQGLESSLEESKYKYKVVEWMEEMARVVYSFKFSQGSHLNLKKTDKNIVSYLGARTKHFRILLFQYNTLIAFKVLITAAMLIIGTYLLIEQKINVGEFIAAEIVILTVISSVEKLMGSIENVYDIITSLEKLGLVVESPMEKDGTHVMVKNEAGISVQVEDVSFSYDNENQILSGVSLQVKPNEIISIIGGNDSGKSTLLKVLSGHYSAFKGSILLNQIPIANYKLESLRGNIGIFTQHQEIFKGSLWENISMGRSEITPDKIITIADLLGVSGFIKALPNGFDTELQAIGKTLPNSINKQILLLRAFANDPKLMLLDEPWIGQDENTKKTIQYALLNYFKNRTIIITTKDELFATQCSNQYYIEHGTILHQNKKLG